MPIRDSIAVVGGGIGGLSAACYLADMGADVTLLEQHDRLGGWREPTKSPATGSTRARRGT